MTPNDDLRAAEGRLWRDTALAALVLGLLCCAALTLGYPWLLGHAMRWMP